MPTYTYKCTDAACEHQFDAIQRITDDPLKFCPQCDEKVKRLIVSGNFILKGEKWHKNSGSY